MKSIVSVSALDNSIFHIIFVYAEYWTALKSRLKTASLCQTAQMSFSTQTLKKNFLTGGGHEEADLHAGFVTS